MYSEDDLLPISALQHLSYCERQCALIHVEGLWAENTSTTHGRHMHERAHGGSTELRGDVLTVRSLRLRSLSYGITGVADIVEFHQEPDGVPLPGRRGRWRPFPVEYKRGKPKAKNYDEVQLCAQTLCLEEMLGAQITQAALFYGKTRHRHDVVISDVLRRDTIQLIARLRDLIESGITPPANYHEKKCGDCSLIDLCLPKLPGKSQSTTRWFERQLDDASR